MIIVQKLLFQRGGIANTSQTRGRGRYQITDRMGKEEGGADLAALASNPGRSSLLPLPTWATSEATLDSLPSFSTSFLLAEDLDPGGCLRAFVITSFARLGLWFPWQHNSLAKLVSV